MFGFAPVIQLVAFILHSTFHVWTSTQSREPRFCFFLFSSVYKSEDTTSFLCDFVLSTSLTFPVDLIELKLAYVHLFSATSNPDDVVFFLRMMFTSGSLLPKQVLFGFVLKKKTCQRQRVKERRQRIKKNIKEEERKETFKQNRHLQIKQNNL